MDYRQRVTMRLVSGAQTMTNPIPYVFASLDGDDGTARESLLPKAGLHVHERRIDALLVDDDLESLEEMQEALELAGAHTLVACNAGEAVRCLRDHEIAVLVTDIRMPGASGLTLAAILRSELRGRAPEVIFVSGHADRDTVAAAARLAPREILVKPVALHHLIATVLAAMAAYAERARARSEPSVAPSSPRATPSGGAAPAAETAATWQVLGHGPAWEIIRQLAGRGIDRHAAPDACAEAALDAEWEPIEAAGTARLPAAPGGRAATPGRPAAGQRKT